MYVLWWAKCTNTSVAEISGCCFLRYFELGLFIMFLRDIQYIFFSCKFKLLSQWCALYWAVCSLFDACISGSYVTLSRLQNMKYSATFTLLNQIINGAVMIPDSYFHFVLSYQGKGTTLLWYYSKNLIKHSSWYKIIWGGNWKGRCLLESIELVPQAWCFLTMWAIYRVFTVVALFTSLHSMLATPNLCIYNFT